LLPDGEGHVSLSVLASYGRPHAESKNLACVEAFRKAEMTGNSNNKMIQ